MKKVTKYKIVYPLVGVIPFLVAMAFFFFYMKVGLFYSVCFGILAGSTGIVISRVIMQNFVDGNNDPKTWQINIYAMLAIGGWVGAILAKTWGMTSLFMCMVACGLLLCFGTRFLKDEDNNGVPDIFEKRGKKKENEEVTPQYMYDHMLFELVGDKIGNEANHNRPLCPYNGKAYTVTEALEAGLSDLAEHGIDYIDNLFMVEKKEENE